MNKRLGILVCSVLGVLVAAAADPGATKPEEVEAAMLPRTTRLIAKNKPVRIVLYGDSISEVKSGWSGGATMPDANWGSQLVKRLAKTYPESTFSVAPFGIGGQNSDEGLGRLDDLEPLKPDLVLVAFGANDCAYHFLKPEETQLALTTLATEIQRRFAADVVLVGTGGDNPLQPFFQHLGKTLAAQREAAAEAGVPFVDIRTAVLQATANGARWAEFHLAEGNCHPNNAGHVVWAETAYAAIHTALGRPDTLD